MFLELGALRGCNSPFLKSQIRKRLRFYLPARRFPYFPVSNFPISNFLVLPTENCRLSTYFLLFPAHSKLPTANFSSLPCALRTNPMRLSPDQTRTILSTVESCTGPLAQVHLYGSRIDDQARGGDVDLLVESQPELTFMQRAKIKLILERELSLPVDILTSDPASDPRPFVSIARQTAIRLERE